MEPPIKDQDSHSHVQFANGNTIFLDLREEDSLSIVDEMAGSLFGGSTLGLYVCVYVCIVISS